METSCYKKPAWKHNGSIRTDLPLTIAARASKRRIMQTMRPGELLCVGKVYLRTHNGAVRIR
ncbi:MAG: hypothetical protein JSU94_03750 [Phycisphaerales bacterium]|nr:MAG: hypothetical protein JSU94_03750 [Phycisphaerales bacterium]